MNKLFRVEGLTTMIFIGCQLQSGRARVFQGMLGSIVVCTSLLD